MSTEELSPAIVKKATNLVRDSKMAVMVGLIPILGLIFILRLVQWYLLRKQYPILVSSDAGEHTSLANDFRSAIPNLWFAVLFWPAVVILLGTYIAMSP